MAWLAGGHDRDCQSCADRALLSKGSYLKILSTLIEEVSAGVLWTEGCNLQLAEADVARGRQMLPRPHRICLAKYRLSGHTPPALLAACLVCLQPDRAVWSSPLYRPLLWWTRFKSFHG